jgi:hypothetical protein
MLSSKQLGFARWRHSHRKRHLVPTPSSKTGHFPITGHKVTEFQNLHFAGRTIGVSGPIPWPPLAAAIRDSVYRAKANDFPDLRHRITDGTASVRPEMLRNTWREPDCGLDSCHDTRGGGGHVLRSVDIEVNFVNLFMFHDKPLVCILTKNKVIQFLYRLLSFRTVCISIDRSLRTHTVKLERQELNLLLNYTSPITDLAVHVQIS